MLLFCYPICYVATPIIIGERAENSKASVPIDKGEISIHSHPLGIINDSGKEHSFDVTPSSRKNSKTPDTEMFPDHKMNSIVGNTKLAESVSPGMPQMTQGDLIISVFGNNVDKPIGAILLDNAKKIIKDQTNK